MFAFIHSRGRFILIYSHYSYCIIWWIWVLTIVGSLDYWLVQRNTWCNLLMGYSRVLDGSLACYIDTCCCLCLRWWGWLKLAATQCRCLYRLISLIGWYAAHFTLLWWSAAASELISLLSPQNTEWLYRLFTPWCVWDGIVWDREGVHYVCPLATNDTV